MSGRALRRPWGGWGARRWRAEVGAWLGFAVLVVGSSAFSTLLFKALDFVAVEITIMKG